MVISSCAALGLGIISIIALAVFVFFARSIYLHFVRYLKKPITMKFPNYRPLMPSRYTGWKLAYVTIIMIVGFFVIRSGIHVKPCGQDKTVVCNCIGTK